MALDTNGAIPAIPPAPAGGSGELPDLALAVPGPSGWPQQPQFSQEAGYLPPPAQTFGQVEPPKHRPQKQHIWDQAAEEVALWIEDMSDAVAEQIKGGGRAPFAARTTNAEKLRYYTEMLFHPDGSPNVEGRQNELERLGVTGYAQVLRAVNNARTKGQVLQPAPPPMLMDEGEY